MSKSDEQMYTELNAKFHKELMDLEQQIEKLDERCNVLRTLLFGEPVYEEDVTARRERYLLGFLKDNPGSSKSQIHEFFDDGTTQEELKRLLENMKRRGAIINEGRGRASVWYATEESK